MPRRPDGRGAGGPKTPAGRARSSQNARKHGLATPVAADAQFSEDIAQLAQQLAGDWDDLPSARAVAEAVIDLQRIRLAKSNLLVLPQILPPPTTHDLIHYAKRADLGLGLDDRMSRTAMRLAKPTRDLAPHEAMALRARDLARLERYERRAFSRLITASRLFTKNMSKSGKTNSKGGS